MMIELVFFFLLLIVVLIPIQLHSKNASELVFLDREHTTSLRGLAIIGIVACHVAFFVAPTYIARLLTPVGGIAVSIFLILSGFGLAESYRTNGLQYFWKKRLRSTYLSYFLIYLVVLPFKLPMPLSKVVLDFMAIEPVAEYYWYVAYLSIWYVSFFLIMQLNSSKVRYCAFFLVFVLSLVILPELQAEQSLSFPVGLLLSKFKSEISKYVRPSFGMLLFVVGTVLLTMKQIPMVRQCNELLFKLLQMSIKLTYALSLTVLVYCLQKRLPIVALTRTGDFSYEIYLIHAYSVRIFSVIESNALAITVFMLTTVLMAVVLKRTNYRIKRLIQV